MIFISILILIVAIALPSFNKQVSPVLFTRISSIIFLYAGALSFNALYIQSIGSGIGIYSGLFHVTIISQFLEVFLLIIGSLILISWPINNSLSNSTTNLPSVANIMHTTNLSYPSLLRENIIKINYATAKEYSLVVLFSTLGASLLVSSCDLISMYLSIELQSFGVYILATLYRNSESATSAGLKYFLLGGLSSCIILLGASLIYTYIGLTNFESIYSLISVSATHNYNNDIIIGLSLGLILIIIGFLFKIAAAPLHYWAPDVYDDSPTIVTIWLTIMPKISILILLLEVFGQTQTGMLENISSHYLQSFASLPTAPTSESITKIIVENTLYSTSPVAIAYVLKILLLISSLLSLIIGTVVGLAQTKIKRLLAYSTISHIGFILLALVINTEQSIESYIFYIIQYSLTNLNTFLIIIALGYIIQQSIINNYYTELKEPKEGRGLKINIRETLIDIKYISELKSHFFSNPILSLSLSICLFSMAGIPPLIGFFAKQFVLYSAIQNGYYFISIVAILVSVISASYYLKLIKVLHTNPEILSERPNTVSTVVEGGYKEENMFEYSENLLNENKKEEVKVLNDQSYLSNQLLSHFHSFLISTLTLTIILFVLKPSIILNSTQLLSLSLYNF
jgi:NADH-ubiquinone oxidoreductase chain 2